MALLQDQPSRQHQTAAQQSWLSWRKIGPWVMGVLAAISLLADLDQLGVSRTWLVMFALLVGLGISGLGAVLFGREWNKPLGWSATKAVAIGLAGIVLISISLVGLVPELFKGLGSHAGPPSPPITLRGSGVQIDLDPADANSKPDLRLYDSYNGPVLNTPEGGTSVFVKVTSPTVAACAAKGWTDEIKAVEGLLICAKTDRNRFVVMEILSASSGLVTFRMMDEGQAATS